MWGKIKTNNWIVKLCLFVDFQHECFVRIVMKTEIKKKENAKQNWEYFKFWNSFFGSHFR